jgi:hypothetical protein
MKECLGIRFFFFKYVMWVDQQSSTKRFRQIWLSSTANWELSIFNCWSCGQNDSMELYGRMKKLHEWNANFLTFVFEVHSEIFV